MAIIGYWLRLEPASGHNRGNTRWCGGANEVMVVVGCCVGKHEAGEGVWAKKLKLSRCGLI